MRNRLSLTFALASATVLVAQAPAPLNFVAAFQREKPAIEAALAEFRPLDALAKAEAIMPATRPVFDASDANKARMCSQQFSYLCHTYSAAGRAAVFAGDWAKGRDYFAKAVEFSKENYEKTSGSLLPILKIWEAPMEEAARELKAGEARYKELKALPAPTEEEQRAIAKFKNWEDNLTLGNKLKDTFTEDLKALKDESESFQRQLVGAEKVLVDEKGRTEKAMADPALKGNMGDYLDSLFAPLNMDACPTKIEKLNFLNRLQFRVNAEKVAFTKKHPAAKKVTLPKAVQEAIDKVMKDENPFASAKKAPAKKAPAPKGKKG